MRYIKFIMSKGKDFTFSEDVAKQILNSKNQIFNIKDKKGNWTGQVLNKAFLVSTDIDEEKSKQYKKIIEGRELEKEMKETKTLDPEKLQKFREKLKDFRNENK